MSKKPPEEKKPAAAEAKQPVAAAEGKKPSRKPPINPFTAEKGRRLGRVGKSGPSRTAWKT